MEVITGGVFVAGCGATYVYAPESEPCCPVGSVRTTSTTPAACWGVVAVIDVAPTTDTSVPGTPPMVTDAPAAKLVPASVTFVPPSVVPVAGTMPLMFTDEGLVLEPQADTTSPNVKSVATFRNKLFQPIGVLANYATPRMRCRRFAHDALR